MLNPYLTNALTKALQSKMNAAGKKVKLPTGKTEFHGQVILDVDVTVNKAADTEYTPTVDVPLKAVLAVALMKAGIQKANITNHIVAAMTEAIELGEEKAEELFGLTDEAEQRVAEALSKLPKQIRSGQTNVVGTVVFADIVEGAVAARRKRIGAA
jgi:hypothetical protein